MQLVTLTSDVGTTDHYAARLRGSLLSVRTDLNIVELNLQLPSFDLVRGAFLFRQSYAAFPSKTTHLVTLYDRTSSRSEMVFFRYSDQRFLGPNNGFFSLVFPGLQVPVYGRSFSEQPTYAQYAQLLSELLNTDKLSDLADTTTLRRGFLVNPIEQMSEIRATVVHVDHFGNVFTNLPHSTFERIAQGRSFELYFKRHEPITEQSKYYQEVAVGTPLCKFDSGVLEIAVNSGSAATLLGLNVDDVVLLTFQNT